MSIPDLAAVIERVESLVQQRMDEERTPGLVLALTDRDGMLHSAAFGYANVDARETMSVDHLLETGSIGKSFTAVALLQLHDEGRLDLHAPISAYLPWFAVASAWAEPTIHHLLSHTSGLIHGSDFAPDPRFEVWALRNVSTGSPPGDFFHYSNVGYKVLGLVLEAIEGKPYAEIISTRVLHPLSMAATSAVITHEVRRRMAQPYAYWYDDRPNDPSDGLVPATWLETNTGDGCLASSVIDLATYLRMYLSRGQGGDGRVLSERAFELMTQSIAPLDPDRGGDYGYGILTGERNDAALIHHDGGMVGYSSSMVGDLDAGLGAVAIVNGPGEPHDIAWFALECLQAAFHRRPLPELPPANVSDIVDNAADFAGTYRTPDTDAALTIVADGQHLYLQRPGERLLLTRRSEDRFYTRHPDFDRFLFRFSKDASGAVSEVTHGAGWYVNDRYDGQTTFDYPAEWDAFPGHYRSHNPWAGSCRVVLRRGQLTIVYPHGWERQLFPLDDGSFRMSDDQRHPERCRFDVVVDGQALRMDAGNELFYRFFTP